MIMMEALSCLLKTATCGGFLSPHKVQGRGGEGIQVSHLLFADNTLIFCEAQEEQITFLLWLLMWFEVISGLRVNLDKSELIPIGRVEDVEELAFELCCNLLGGKAIVHLLRDVVGCSIYICNCLRQN